MIPFQFRNAAAAGAILEVDRRDDRDQAYRNSRAGQSAGKNPHMTPNTSLAPLRVLVVDDEALIRWSIGESLAREGHRVLEASSAQAALDLINSESEPIDVVLLDLRLPDSRDLGLLGRIRQLSPGTAIVLMTAYGTPDLVEHARALGACAVIGKPFDMFALDALVRDAHGGRGTAIAPF
jgi:DNA-binding NtrC family response regulator